MTTLTTKEINLMIAALEHKIQEAHSTLELEKLLAELEPVIASLKRIREHCRQPCS